MDKTIKMLFVCVENSCRSQMAEGFARVLGGGRAEAASAGSRPSGEVNPRAVELMAEKGVDISDQRSKGLDEVPSGGYDAVVTMGCGEECPVVEGARREDWGLPDPKGLDDEGFRAVRDEIERRVATLLEDLGDGP